jgi:hypothetical protein
VKTFFLIFGIIAALSIIPCVILMVRKHAALRVAEQCEGTVIGHVAKRGSGKRASTTYALKIAYKDRAGAEHEFTTAVGSNPPSHERGAKLTVFHHADGRRPDVLSFAYLYFGYWLWLCVAVCAIGCLVAPHLLPRIYLR